MRGINYLLVLGLGAFMIGCTNSAQEAQTSRWAAYASSTKYPTTQASDDLRAAAVVNRDDNSIRILNFSNRSLVDVNVWINGSFVHRLDNFPANGIVRLDPENFYDASGRSMASQHVSPVTIQLETRDGLFNLQGPIFE